MYSIGIRVSTTKIYYAVVMSDGEEFEIKRCSHINIPISLEVPEQLAFLRTNLLAIILEYGIVNAGLRITETIAKTPSVFRMNVEGVIQELFANSTIENYSIMKIAQIAGILGEDKSTIKSYFDASEVFAEIEDWTTYKLEERECLVAATASSLLSEVR